MLLLLQCHHHIVITALNVLASFHSCHFQALLGFACGGAIGTATDYNGDPLDSHHGASFLEEVVPTTAGDW